MSNNAHELSYRLLNALDKEYNVVDMQAVNEIISILEKFNITKELLETTRLGKYVNELRRKTTDPTLARRAKVLVKRWRDLVMPAVASPAHTGPGSNRSSAERTYRRFGGTPLTSPALSMHAVSPAVPSPRLPTRPAWGGYESDSQDVILVDDDPPAAPPAPLPHAPLPLAHKPTTPPVKRPPSPEIVVQDDKKAKRDKKPKKRRGHSRAGSGTETTTPATSPPMPMPMPTPAATATPTPTAPALAQTWGARNGSAPERRRNGWRRETTDPYAALVNRLPPAGAKKVKTTKELLEQLQSKGNAPLSRASSPGDPASPDVMVIEPDTVTVKVESPLRNGTGGDLTIKEEPVVERSEEEMEPLEEEREWVECTCGWDDEGAGGVEAERACPAAAVGAARRRVRPRHVRALHHALLPGVNGTRAPALPQRFAVRAAADPARPGLFASVVPLYKYTDYADDYCAKNMAHVPICTELPWTEFAPAPPSPPPPPDPPELRPYPWPDGDPSAAPVAPAEPVADGSPSLEPAADAPTEVKVEYPTEIEAEAVGVPTLEPSERLKAPLLSTEEATQFGAEPASSAEVVKSFASEPQEHRTVERTKGDVDGRALYGLCRAALRSVPWTYEQAAPAPEVRASQLEAPDGDDVLEEALALAYDDEPARPARDELGRPRRPERFAEWHEPARLGDLVALPYVVLD